jgi:competence protein ComEC
MRAYAPALAAAFAAGLLLGDRLPPVAPFAAAGAACALLAACSLRRRPCAALACACAAALAAGAALLGGRVARALPQLAAPARETVLEGRVVRAERTPGGARVVLHAVAWIAPHAEGPTRALLWSEPSAMPPVGATLRAAVRTRSLAAGVANPGGTDVARSLARRGIGASARAIHPLLVAIVEEPSPNPLNELENLRAGAIERLRASGRGGALLAALSLGDAEGLPTRDRAAWAALGIAHLLSVSGLHLALAGGGAYALAARALRRSAALAARIDTRRAALLGALAAAALYAVLAGLAEPARRSLAMLAAVAVAIGLRRAASPAHALGCAALLVLALEPAALFAVGAQLSFAATAALVLGRASAAEGKGGRVRRGLASTLSATARATLATAPIAALHFGAAPPLAGVANLLAVPLTAALGMPLAFAAATLALVAGEGTPSAWLGAASRLAEWGLDGALALSALAPRVAPHPPAGAALGLALVLCALGLATRRLWLRTTAAFLAQLALAALPAPVLEPAAPRIVFLDVGHGDAALVQASDFALLVDAGASSPGGWDAGARIVVPALAALGVRRLDALAITHADLDHRGGASAVLGAFPCEELWLPRGALGAPAFEELAAEARARGARVVERGAGDAPLVRGGLRVAPLWPPAGAGELSDNDRSLVLRVEIGTLRALLLGDLEARGEQALLASGAALGADLLKLAHHGSRSSSTAALLAAVAPRLAVASAPLRGRFGWPHREVRARVALAGSSLAWTGRDGALLVAAARAPCVRRWRRDAGCRPLTSGAAASPVP